MDQIKTHLAVVLKYGFWIGCSIVLFGSLGIWYTTTATLAKESASQTSSITSAIGTVSSVQQELPTLPNQHSHDEMNLLIEARQVEVLRSWQTLYDRQRGILTWPVKELKQDFVDEFKDLIPVETFVNFPTDEADEKETTLLNRYSRYIKNVLPDIAKIARTEWTAEFESSAGGMEEMGMGMGMGMGAAARRTPIIDITGARGGPLVTWGAASQEQVLKDLFPWRGQQPSTLEVYYSQENIWILKQLLQIIDAVNGEATQPYQAKIHEIQAIAIGKSVKFGAGNVSKPGASNAGGMMGGSMDMEMGMSMSMEMDSEMMGGMDFGGGFGGSTIDPVDYRYVNASLEPITGATLRSALSSNSPNDASLAVAKRVPVMMKLSMDQRAVHELLAICGSVPLMVEVKQVRVLPKSRTQAGAAGGGDEMEMGMGGGSMGMGGGSMGMGGGSASSGMTTEDEFPLDMSVEIYGIINMYNPPDAEKFGVKDVTEDTVIDGDTETLGGQKVPPAAAPPADGELPTPQDPEAAPPEATPPEAVPPETAPETAPAAPDGSPPPPVAGAPTGAPTPAMIQP